MENCTLYTLTVLLILATLLYKYLTRNNGYWKAKGVPEAKGAVFGFGHALDQFLMKKNMGMLAETIYKNNPNDDMVGIYVNRTPGLVVRHPDLVKFVLNSGFAHFSENTMIDPKLDPLLYHDPFFQNGQMWKDGRAIFVSAFSSKKLKNLIPAISGTCDKLMNYLKEKIPDSKPVEFELKELYSRYTAGVAANAILGIDDRTFVNKKEANSLYNMMNAIFQVTTDTGLRQNLVLLLPALSRWTSTSFAPKWVNDGFAKIVNDIEAIRKNDQTPRIDILQHISNYLKEKDMDKGELAAHAFGFVIEAYETSSLTLSFLTYFLSKNPRVQKKMRDEVEEVLKKHGSLCSYEAINDMIYIEQAIKESLRLFPPLGKLHRICSKAVTLAAPDGLTCNLKPGDEVHVPVAALQRDPKYWDNPDEFIPERFDKANDDKRAGYVYLPLGEGPRMCPGSRMGYMQIKAALANILMNYVIEPSVKMNEPLQIDPRYFMTTIIGGFWVYFKPRI